MANVRVKKDGEMHHIHVSDDIPMPVHLGTDPYSARRRIVELKNSKNKHNKLDRDIADLQHRLRKVADHGRPLEHGLADVKKNHYREKMYSKMVSAGVHEGKAEQAALLVTMMVCSFIFLVYLIETPMITGSAVLSADISPSSLLAMPLAGNILAFLVVIGVAGTVLHAKFHVRKMKHDSCRPNV